ncbi:uncharacterized protein LOC135474608 isoform X2 [Liolophura sinensis]|uniref:uncharacterized protein LOC135474608 isoform X2 n=1 Tax=Liolophura sinensis TaxID=3198878 RepID=UPI003159313E
MLPSPEALIARQCTAVSYVLMSQVTITMHLLWVGCLALLVLGRTELATSEDWLPCGGIPCRTVSRRGMIIPQYCGVEDRCEPCSTSACKFPNIPLPCRAFCSGEPPTTVPDKGQTKSLSVSTQPGKKSPTGKDANPSECGQHGSVVVTILSLTLLVSVLLNIALIHPVIKTRLYYYIGGNLNVLRGVTHAPVGTGEESADQKAPLVGEAISGSQASLASQRSSSESLRHIRTHPEDETNAHRELDLRIV